MTQNNRLKFQKFINFNRKSNTLSTASTYSICFQIFVTPLCNFIGMSLEHPVLIQTVIKNNIDTFKFTNFTEFLETIYNNLNLKNCKTKSNSRNLKSWLCFRFFHSTWLVLEILNYNLTFGFYIINTDQCEFLQIGQLLLLLLTVTQSTSKVMNKFTIVCS